MPDVLNAFGAPPPAPQMPQQISPLAMPPAMPTAMPQNGLAPRVPVPPPAPNHQQTVAALRHFGAIEREISTLLADPDLGRTDMRSKIIDGATSLVAQGIVTPAQAVAQLGSVPDRPFEQKQWLMRNFAQTIQAQNAVLDQHRAAFAGAPPVDDHGDPDDHLGTVAGLMGQYQGPQGPQNAG